MILPIDQLEELKPDLRLYHELLEERAKIDMRMEVIKENIQHALEASGNAELKAIGVGRFTLEKRRNWSFPENIVMLEKQVEDQKLKAKQVGLATFKEVTYLKFYEEKP